MKIRVYIKLVLFAGINCGVIAEPQKFSNFEIKGRQDYLAGLVKCIEFGPSEIPGLVDSKGKVWDKLSVQDYWELINKAVVITTKGERDNYTICSRNAALLQEFLYENKIKEQEMLHEIGYFLRSNEFNIFPKSEDSVSFFNLINQETGAFEKPEKAPSNRGFGATSLPCIILGVKVYDANVSNAEIGYVAYKMLQAGKDCEIVNDRYRLELRTLSSEQFAKGF